MFIRVFQAIVRPGLQEPFKRVLETMTLTHLPYHNGIVAFLPGQPTGANTDEFVLVTVWRDAAAARTDDEKGWAHAIIPPEALPMLKEFHIQAYQAFERFGPSTRQSLAGL